MSRATVRVPDPTKETVRPSGWQRIERRLGSQEENEVLMDRCMAAHDYDGALVAATALFQRDPGHESARKIKTRVAFQGATHPTSASPGARAIPRRQMAWDDLHQLELRREDVFVLTFVDGSNDLETILDMAGLPSYVISNCLERLVSLGVIAI